MKKLYGIVCLSKDFNKPGNSGSFRDYLYIKKELERIGEVVTINRNNLDYLESKGRKKFDGIVMLNASVNFFGGVLDKSIVRKWNLIFGENCPVFYWFTDFLLPLKNFHKTINKRFGESENVHCIDPKPENIYLISYAKELDLLKKWWKGKGFIEYKNAYFYDISESCFKHLPHLEPKAYKNENIVYVGNFRNGHRFKQITKLSEDKQLEIYGRWPEKSIPENVIYHGPCKETDVDDILNDYYGQYITYDYEYLKFKPVIFRHIITINSGTLPIIDPKVDYLKDIPGFKLLTKNKGLKLTEQERFDLIYEQQKWLENYFENNFAERIEKICS